MAKLLVYLLGGGLIAVASMLNAAENGDYYFVWFGPLIAGVIYNHCSSKKRETAFMTIIAMFALSFPLFGFATASTTNPIKLLSIPLP